MITTKTVYDKKLLDEFASFILKKNKALIVIYICSAVILASSIAMFCIAEYIDGVLYALIGIFFACYGLILKVVLTNSHKKVYGNYEIYEFDDQFFTIKTYLPSGEQLSAGTMRYDHIYKIYQNNTKTYILISKYSAYIIDKNNFENESDYVDVINKLTQKFRVIGEKK